MNNGNCGNSSGESERALGNESGERKKTADSRNREVARGNNSNHPKPICGREEGGGKTRNAQPETRVIVDEKSINFGHASGKADLTPQTRKEKLRSGQEKREERKL